MNFLARSTLLFFCMHISLFPHGNAVPSMHTLRSQGENLVREMVGWQSLINQCDFDTWNGVFAIVPEFSQSFRADQLCGCIFGDDVSDESECSDACPCTLLIAGSCVTDRAERAWLADYFGLPTDYQSAISFKPRVQNEIVDLQFSLGLDEWVPGLYLQLFMPIAHTKWQLRFCESIIDEGAANYAPGYFSPTGIPRANLLLNATEFFTGTAAPDLGDAVSFESLTSSKWAQCGHQTKTRIADLHVDVGYNVLCTDDYYLGLCLRAVAPTGNRPTGEFLFEPIAGNGHHWELGAGLTAHYVLYRNCKDSTFSFYFDSRITHLFKTCQTRSFDLCSQHASSRYMLAEKLGPNTEMLSGISNGTTTLSTFQFANAFAPVANLTRSIVDVSVAVQGDLALMFIYEHANGMSGALGYEFWGKSCEKICRKRSCHTSDPLDGNSWALKGDAYVYGFSSLGSNALAATENSADIHAGTNFPGVDCSDEIAQLLAQTNLNIDNAELAIVQTPSLLPLFLAPNGSLPNARTHTSIQPIALSLDDLDLSSQKGISHKLFVHYNRTWLNHELKPFFGCGISAEFGNDKEACACSKSTRCKNHGSCIPCAVSQWSVWLKGGIAFN